MREGQVRAHLVKRVKEIGGEIRKVQWVGRKNAPDELVMLPFRWIGHPSWRAKFEARAIFIELKATGLATTFPADAHERAQWREHERMRKFGLRVEVIDSIEGVEDLLR